MMITSVTQAAPHEPDVKPPPPSGEEHEKRRKRKREEPTPLPKKKFKATESKKCHICGSTSHLRTECPQNNSWCPVHQTKSHDASECRAMKKGATTSSTQRNESATSQMSKSTTTQRSENVMVPREPKNTSQPKKYEVGGIVPKASKGISLEAWRANKTNQLKKKGPNAETWDPSNRDWTQYSNTFTNIIQEHTDTEAPSTKSTMKIMKDTSMLAPMQIHGNGKGITIQMGGAEEVIVKDLNPKGEAHPSQASQEDSVVVSLMSERSINESDIRCTGGGRDNI
jgi:hypothetical protein